MLEQYTLFFLLSFSTSLVPSLCLFLRFAALSVSVCLCPRLLCIQVARTLNLSASLYRYLSHSACLPLSLCLSAFVSLTVSLSCSVHLIDWLHAYTFSSLTPAACNSLFYLLLHPNLPLQFLSQPTPPLTATSPSLRLSAPISMPPTYASVCLLSV